MHEEKALSAGFKRANSFQFEGFFSTFSETSEMLDRSAVEVAPQSKLIEAIMQRLLTKVVHNHG